MKRYAEYKDSGVEWIGEIPTDWKVKKFNSVCATITDYVASGSFADLRENVKYYDDENYAMLIRTTDVSGKSESVTPVYVDEQAYSFLSNSNLFGGEIILPNIGASVGDVYIVPKLYERMTLAPNSIMFKSNYVDKYYYYYFCSKAGRESVIRLAQSAAQPKFNKTELRQLKVTVPTYKTQQDIVEFLDQKTSDLDALIADKQKLTELLKEKRQAIISEVVTKGLDKTGKMKDSGIEWIGEIPGGWKVTKIKYNTYVKGRIGWQGLKTDEFIDKGAYLVTGTDIMNGRISWDTCYHIGDERYNEAPEIQLKNDDLLITKDGTIGKIAIVKDMPYKAILNSGLFVTRPLEDAYTTSYMYWLLNSKVFWDYYGYLETGSTIKHLYQETFENFSFPLPSVDEQTGIVFYLEQKTSAIDSLITDITTQIEKLKEYRQSIISEAVTGKVAI